jgi:hypothetical protein
MKKGAIGNALRNAAMRFGVGLDLWTKESDAPATKPASKTQESNGKFLSLKAMIDIAESHAELANVANTIQATQLDDKERDALRLLWKQKSEKVG